MQPLECTLGLVDLGVVVGVVVVSCGRVGLRVMLRLDEGKRVEESGLERGDDAWKAAHAVVDEQRGQQVDEARGRSLGVEAVAPRLGARDAGRDEQSGGGERMQLPETIITRLLIEISVRELVLPIFSSIKRTYWLIDLSRRLGERISTIT